MPPFIYKSGIRAFNYPHGRQYHFAGESWLALEFSPFSVEMHSGQESLSAIMPVFNFHAESVKSDISIIPIFPSFEAAFESAGGGTLSFDIVFPKSIMQFGGNSIECDISVFDISASSVCTQLSKITFDANTLNISADGGLVGYVTITLPSEEESSEGPNSVKFTGDKYIVLNLKTGAHSEYMDGNNNAIAKTGGIKFGSNFTKNISDAYILSRVEDILRLIVTADESIEREYVTRYKVGNNGNSSNKKIRMAKGIKGTTWEVSVVSEDGSHVEVHEIDVVVNKTGRRV